MITTRCVERRVKQGQRSHNFLSALLLENWFWCMSIYYTQIVAVPCLPHDHPGPIYRIPCINIPVRGHAVRGRSSYLLFLEKSRHGFCACWCTFCGSLYSRIQPTGSSDRHRYVCRFVSCSGMSDVCFFSRHAYVRLQSSTCVVAQRSEKMFLCVPYTGRVHRVRIRYRLEQRDVLGSCAVRRVKL